MKQVLGIFGLLVAICVFTLMFGENFDTAYNIENLFRRLGPIGIISIGAAIVIIGRGIDLSIGSVICLVGVLIPMLLVEHRMSPWLVLPAVMALALLLGLFHGLYITRMGAQPFVVTLCGLLIYRGVARGLTGDQVQGFRGEWSELRRLTTGRIPIPGIENFAMPISFLILVAVAIAAVVLLHRTVYGRHLFAVGRSEPAARYSGINTRRVTTISYVICSGLAGLGGVLYVFDIGLAQPVDHGNFYELYAITAAVLGGCSLLGGEGSILGTIIGAAVMVVLYNTIRLVDWIQPNIEMAVLGAVLLGGVTVDLLVKKALARRLVRVTRMKGAG
ncbi:MAG: ABC transporter permease [Planctomycetota bacterium]|jgi:ribose transport system permease protein